MPDPISIGRVVVRAPRSHAAAAHALAARLGSELPRALTGSAVVPGTRVRVRACDAGMVAGAVRAAAEGRSDG
nr:hypothetical protein [uncultured bacterium]